MEESLKAEYEGSRLKASIENKTEEIKTKYPASLAAPYCYHVIKEKSFDLKTSKLSVLKSNQLTIHFDKNTGYNTNLSFTWNF